MVKLFLTTLFAFLSAAEKLHLTPAPSGPYAVGTTIKTLTDYSREDVRAANKPRRVVIQLFYPSKDKLKHPAPWAPAKTLRTFEKLYELPTHILDVIYSNSYTDAPPVDADQISSLTPILFSPDLGNPRVLHTSQLEDLASHGYLVVAIDHPHDALIVEFPDQKFPPVYNYDVHPGVEDALLTDDELKPILKTRVADTIFVAKSLDQLLAQIKPNMDRIGIFGHGIGGTTAIKAMKAEPDLFCGGVIIGGPTEGETDTDLGKPLLMMTGVKQAHRDKTQRQQERGLMWKKFMTRQSGWIRELSFEGFEHGTFSDQPLIVKMLGLEKKFPLEELEELLGTVEPVRSAMLQRVYVKTFFEWIMTGSKYPVPRILEEKSEKFPEVEMVDIYSNSTASAASLDTNSGL